MSQLNINKLLMIFAAKARPILVRLFPIAFLRRVKKIIINRTINGMSPLTLMPFDRGANPDGINLIGYIKGQIGLGQSCRLVADAINASGINFTVYNYEQVSAMQYNDDTWGYKITNTTPYNVNILHLNPYEIPIALLQLGRDRLDYRYNIGFWLWELEKFPEEWESSLNVVDEVWTPSEFASDSIRKITGKPVYTIPYPISAPTDTKFNRDYFNLPADKFLFLCIYDSNSTMDRKNPMGIINAYKKAFHKENPQIGLVIKVNNPQKEDLLHLKELLKGYINVYFVTDVLEKVQVNSLIACIDVVVSLHRSEGFGLVMAEAMLVGTPCIATNWSSNTEFMNSDVACMVDYTFLEITKDCGPYKVGNRWADPDLDQASGYMKKLYSDKEFYSNISQKAKAYVQQKLSLNAATELLNKRIKEIYEQYS